MDRKYIKENLDPAFVMHKHGHEPAAVDPGVLRYYSPFRTDENPSFDLFKNQAGEWRWGDRPEGTQGDTIDLVARFMFGRVQDNNYTKAQHAEALAVAEDMLDEQATGTWTQTELVPRGLKSLDADRIQELIDTTHPGGSVHWFALSAERPALDTPYDVPWLRHDNHDRLLWFIMTRDGECVGVRYRDIEGEKWAERGSKNLPLRFRIKDEIRDDLPLFLAEGETDAAAAFIQLGDRVEVLGILGVGNNAEKQLETEPVDGRVVYIAFDPDESGLDAVHRYSSYLTGRGATVRVIVPPGRDLSELHPDLFPGLLDTFRSVSAPPPDVTVLEDQYVGVAGEKPRLLSNFVLEPTHRLANDGEVVGYECILRPAGKVVVVTLHEIGTDRRLADWASSYGYAWWGSYADAQKVRGLIQSQAVFLPERTTSNQAGLVAGTFVYPGGYIGKVPALHVGEMVNLTGIRLDEYPCTDPIAAFWAMYDLQDPAITSPILAWLAMAPLRTRWREFPFLNVSGTSGSGKTTLTEALVSAFSGTCITTNLTSTTPHAVSGMVGSTNAFPVWFDEYRPGARDDARLRLDQTLRDAYTGQVSARGGMTEDKSKVTNLKTLAPIVITGENLFSETSHRERSVMLRTQRKGKRGNVNAVRGIRGFAVGYLQHLQHRSDTYDEPAVTRHYPTAPLDPSFAHLPDRPRNTIAVLQAGWWELASYLQYIDPEFGMPGLDLSQVLEHMEQEQMGNPIEDLLQVCLDNHTFDDTVLVKDGALLIHPQNVLTEARKHPSIRMPVDNKSALIQELKDQWNAENKAHWFGGQTKRFWTIAPEVVQSMAVHLPSQEESDV